MGVKSPMHQQLVKNIRIFGYQSMIRVLNDPRDWALTVSVGWTVMVYLLSVTVYFWSVTIYLRKQ